MIAAMINTPPQTLEPSSPMTTLRNSINAAKAELEASKVNLKSAKRQHKTSLAQALKDQQQKVKLANTGGADDRHRQRVKQLENSIAKSKIDQQGLEKDLIGFCRQERPAKYPQQARQDANQAKGQVSSPYRTGEKEGCR
jgi:hypothetical protein